MRFYTYSIYNRYRCFIQFSCEWQYMIGTYWRQHACKVWYCIWLLLRGDEVTNISRQKWFSCTAMPSILSPSDVMQKGLGYIGIGREQQAKMSLKVKVEDFKAHYGSSPLVIANIWYDLCHTSIEEAHLDEKETYEKGFKQYMLAHFHLWSYPKNVNLMKTRFNICMRYLEGKELWYWPKKIGALKNKKIVWSSDLRVMKLPSLPFPLMVWTIGVGRRNTQLSTKTPIFTTTSIIPVVSSMRLGSWSMSPRLLGSRGQSGAGRVIMMSFDKMDWKKKWSRCRAKWAWLIGATKWEK